MSGRVMVLQGNRNPLQNHRGLLFSILGYVLRHFSVCAKRQNVVMECCGNSSGCPTGECNCNINADSGGQILRWRRRRWKSSVGRMRWRRRCQKAILCFVSWSTRQTDYSTSNRRCLALTRRMPGSWTSPTNDLAVRSRTRHANGECLRRRSGKTLRPILPDRQTNFWRWQTYVCDLSTRTFMRAPHLRELHHYLARSAIIRKSCNRPVLTGTAADFAEYNIHAERVVSCRKSAQHSTGTWVA